MFEAEHNNIQSYDIDVTIEKYRNGYLMSYTPSEEWVMSEERNFPIIIDPDINISDNIYTSTLSESAPTSYITGNKLKIGGVPNDHFKALISIPLPSTTFSNDLISITDAKLYMYFNDYSGLSYQNGLRISALLSSYMPWWSGVSSNSLSQLERFELTGSGLKGLDVTPLVNGWYNYLRSNSKVGVYPYGVVIDSHYNYCCVYEADSSSGTNPPYYMISYKLNSNYTLTYTPDKYNDCNDIHNFTDRMNCYAYAL